MTRIKSDGGKWGRSSSGDQSSNIIRVVTETRNFAKSRSQSQTKRTPQEKHGRNGSKVLKGNLHSLRFQKPWTRRIDKIISGGNEIARLEKS